MTRRRVPKLAAKHRELASHGSPDDHLPNESGSPLSPVIAKAVAEIEHRLRPAAVLLFGSEASGRATSSSDVDFALVLARHTAEPEGPTYAIIADIEAIVGRPVDLVVLDGASPVIAMEALRSGHLLACSDSEALERFTVRTLTDYADLKIVRRPIEERLLRPAGT